MNGDDRQRRCQSSCLMPWRRHPFGAFFICLILLSLSSANMIPIRRRYRERSETGHASAPTLPRKSLPRYWREPQGGKEVPEDPTVKGSWYPQFPKCESFPVARLEYPTGQTPPCVQLPLSPEVAKFTKTTAAEKRPPVNTTYPGYLFVLGTAYGGTTALLGLLSSSPKVSVPEEGWAHEGHWQLVSSQAAITSVAFLYSAF